MEYHIVVNGAEYRQQQFQKLVDDYNNGYLNQDLNTPAERIAGDEFLTRALNDVLPKLGFTKAMQQIELWLEALDADQASHEEIEQWVYSVTHTRE